jgi:hypothetical protein
MNLNKYATTGNEICYELQNKQVETHVTGTSCFQLDLQPRSCKQLFFLSTAWTFEKVWVSA